MENTTDSLERLPATEGSVTAGVPSIDWKSKCLDLERNIAAMEAAAIFMHDEHRRTGHCECPNTCGGCHFWSGARETCRDLRVGDKSIINKALIIAAMTNAEVSDRRAHGNDNTTGANGGSLH